MNSRYIDQDRRGQLQGQIWKDSFEKKKSKSKVMVKLLSVEGLF